MNCNNIYLIEYNNNIIRVYDDEYKAHIFIESCLQNGFMTHPINIVTFMTNSCIKTHVVNYKQGLINNNSQKIETKPQIIKELNETSNEIIDNETEEFLELAKQKINIQHDINLLNKKKHRLEELKQIYDTDLNLYNTFKEKNINFVIPPLFVDKYNLFNKLELENNISFGAFMKEFNNNNDITDSFLDNDYNNKFYKKECEININEECEININEECEIKVNSDCEYEIESTNSDTSDCDK